MSAPDPILEAAYAQLRAWADGPPATLRQASDNAVAAVRPLIEAEVLAREADWLDRARANAAAGQFPADFLLGWAGAAGWVRLHGERPSLRGEAARGDA